MKKSLLILIIVVLDFSCKEYSPTINFKESYGMVIYSQVLTQYQPYQLINPYSNQSFQFQPLNWGSYNENLNNYIGPMKYGDTLGWVISSGLSNDNINGDIFLESVYIDKSNPNNNYAYIRISGEILELTKYKLNFIDFIDPKAIQRKFINWTYDSSISTKPFVLNSTLYLDSLRRFGDGLLQADTVKDSADVIFLKIENDTAWSIVEIDVRTSGIDTLDTTKKVPNFSNETINYFIKRFGYVSQSVRLKVFPGELYYYRPKGWPKCRTICFTIEDIFRSQIMQSFVNRMSIKYFHVYSGCKCN